MWPWSWLRGAGPSGFGYSSTAEQVTEGVDASHLTAIVTGATSGIGRETARVLALRGAKVIIPARSLESGTKVKESLLEENPKANIQVMEMDVSSLHSVASFASSFNSSRQPLNILINNAGIMACPFQLSKDGVELQFATNHLGHFLLTNLLLDKMKTTARETGVQGRIINISSYAHKWRNSPFFDLDTLNDQSKYELLGAYGRSKLANILHANELSRRLKEEGADVTANSLHPGTIPTKVVRYVDIKGIVLSLAPVGKLFMKSEHEGAATTCYVALHPNLKDVTGKYFENCNEFTPTIYARDEDLGKKLWDFSQELIEKLHKQA